ncbi:phosphoadenylylsulfate reductase (thioredoxin) [Luteibacter rhizovicinus]|uniref:Phosphoadenosine 5'-phosphosulfate reductase n=1 Tax=Luteibacter rhizovicinus TaxID=242606 RepID=A0A4R3Z1F8_9GAMM|nr:phosphoadenylyl-sulfate reductase [Luteibacter rhizovicinus]TCV97684.1 phosphoadenylylsulfate reductase (thioredoxin) [Luteibacter rhizovicinus]
MNEVDAINEHLADLDAQGRVAWALENLPGEHVLSSSFGAQAAVSLHLATSIRPDLPVVVIDTGYLFEQTYRFIDTLSTKLRLNLKVYASPLSPACHEASRGRLWEQGAEGLAEYNRVRKVEPMQRALAELGAGTWFAGLRRGQSRSRASTPFARFRDGRWKVHPIADWSDRDVGRYLSAHGLPYHPLWDEGYVSIGDTHTTRRLESGMDPEDTRFFGWKRECGLHDPA